MVVPAISEKVRPVIEAHVGPVEPADAPSSATTSTLSSAHPPVGSECQVLAGVCADPSAPVVVDLPPALPAEPVPVAAAEPVTEPAVSTTVAETSPEPTSTVTDAPAVETPAEPAPVEPTAETTSVEPTAEPVPVEPTAEITSVEPTAEPAPVEPHRRNRTRRGPPGRVTAPRAGT